MKADKQEGVQEFLNPKSMLTPGIAGTTMMFIVNGVCAAFPEVSPRYLAIVLSFLIASCVLKTADMGRMQRGLYWVLNALVIFVVGFGATNIGRSVSLDKPQRETSSIFMKSAFAGDAREDAGSKPDAPKKKPKGEGNKSGGDEGDEDRPKYKEDKRAPKQGSYFLDW